MPPFLKDTGRGWITAEYGMLPGATNSRYRRETGQSGRTMEIQRLIGRSLRMMVDLAAIGERTLRVDCDVLNADGGTRPPRSPARLWRCGTPWRDWPPTAGCGVPAILPVAAVSAGIVDGRALLDLD